MFGGVVNDSINAQLINNSNRKAGEQCLDIFAHSLLI